MENITSIALPSIMRQLNINKTDVGLIGSSFFWMYALGQLINGYLGDRFNSRYFVFAGLIFSALTNFLFGFSNDLITMVVLWGTNGFFLSTLWGPIVKTLSQWFPREYNNSVAVGISTSMIGGYFAAWGLIGVLLGWLPWNYAFWIPSIIVAIISIIWLAGIHLNVSVTDNGSVLHDDIYHEISLWKLIYKKGVWIIAISCIIQGIIKDGIGLWGPTFLHETHNLTQKYIAIFSLTIPVLSFIGIIFSGWLNKLFKYNENRSIAFLLLGGSVTSLILLKFYHSSAVITSILLGLLAALMYGANTLLLTIVPLNFTKYNRVSSIAGFLDFSSYIGSVLSGIFTGYISDTFGWGTMVLSWVILALIGAVVLAFFNRNARLVTDKA